MKKTDSYKSFMKSDYHCYKHSTYFNVYDKLFEPYRNKNVTFVEIGILEGGSLHMWRDFFGDKARIIGVDLNPDSKKWEKFGFEIYIGSQSDIHFWDKFFKKTGPVDIVLDDGGHTYDQQIITVESVLENLNDKGVLVVEDTHTSYQEGFGSLKYSFIEYTKLMIDKVNYRFGNLNDRKSENRFWSIEIFESIVAFHINIKSVDIISYPIINNGKRDFAKDFRMKGFSKSFYFFRRILKKKIFRNKIIKILKKPFKEFYYRLSSKSKIFFKY